MTTLVEQPSRAANVTAAASLRRGGVLLGALVVLLLVGALSLLLGTRSVSPVTVRDALFHDAGTDDQSVGRPPGVVTVTLGGAYFAWLLARAARSN